VSSTTSTPATSAAADRRSLPVRAGTAAAVAVAGNLVLSQALRAAVDADPDFVGLQPGPVLVASVVGVLLGAAAYAVLRRIGRQRLFVPIVAVGALLSLGGPLGLLGATPAEQPGVTDAAALALIPLHLLVAVVAAAVLPDRDR
jgi:drug/metabolite transporter (DMT)-like permease